MHSASKWIILSALTMLVFVETGFCTGVAKICVVEVQRLFDNSAAGKVIKREITAQGKKMEAELKEMYKNSIMQYRNWNSEDDLLFAQLMGAADVLAWILEIPDESHKKNKGG